MKVRYAKFEDMKAVSKIKVDMWKTAYKGIVSDEYLNSLNYEESQKKHEDVFEKDFWAVYENDNNEILGFCWFGETGSLDLEELREYDSELIAIYVRPDSKGQGIGKIMFQFVVNELKSKNKIKMILWVLEDNKPSIEFYKKMGGKLITKKEQKIGKDFYSFISFGYEL